VMRDLVQQFVDTTRGRVDELGALLASGDAAGVSRLCHIMRGSSATLGATRLAAVLGEIEAAMADGDLAGARARVAELHEEHDRAVAALDSAFPAP
jgi:HPt (histidine-containing phosphotransfer) domain-containing protein